MAIVGCDPDGMDRLSDRVNAVSRSLTNLCDDVSERINRLPWRGDDAAMLQESWRTRGRDSTANAVTLLDSISETLKSNSSDQREASKSGGTLVVRNLDDPKQGYKDDHAKKGSDSQRDDFEKKSFRNTPLYADDGPNASDVNQGQLGDCWLEAALSSMAATEKGREKLKKMIQENGDGTYTVTFADGSEVKVDADLYVDANGNPAYNRSEVLWPSILEKAYAAKLDGDYGNIEGGDSAAALKVLGGYDIDTLELNPSWKRDPADSFITEKINQTIKAGLPVTANSSDHAWSILGVENDCVRIRNPWGTNPYDDNEALWNDVGISKDELSKFDRGGGILEIPIADFSAGWQSVSRAKA